MDKLNGEFHISPNLGYIDSEGMEHEFHYAINMITDLATLMLECSVNGSVSLGELLDDENEKNIRITFTETEKDAINRALAQFVNKPLSYDLHEMVPDEDMLKMAWDCENLRKELCE